MAQVMEIHALQLVDESQDLSIQEESKMKSTSDEITQVECENHHGVCAICLKMIVLQETALVKGCEHAYCVNCILRWAACKKEPTCPQCKHPFEFLNIHRALDGSIHDYMFEESVCLLLRASWFKPLTTVGPAHVVDDYVDAFSFYEEVDLDDDYLGNSTNICIGNRRWGDNGYVRAGRQEARPSVGPSRQPKNKDTCNETIGRRAKRALKRELADKAAAAQNQ